MSLYDNKEKIEWPKRVLEYKSSYVIESRAKIIYIHDNEVNNISEFNLLHDIINISKRTININSHYSPILHGCMNIIKVRSNFKNFLILLDSGCSSTIVVRRLVEKLGAEKYSVMQWQTEAGSITTNYNIDVYFTLPALSVTNLVTWKCHVDDSSMGKYGMILGRDILT